MEILRLIGIKKTFGLTELLKGVNLTLRKGDFAAILGPSGSGKSTLLHLAAGLETPDRGEVYLFGRRIDNLSEEERDRYRLGKVAFVFQYHYLLEDFTVWENLLIFGELLKVPNAVKKTREILIKLGLWEKRHQKPTTLSGGERQRLSVARAILSGAPLILADEPTGNLDPQNAENLFNLFKELNERGTTFLVVTHNRNLLKFFNKVYHIENGLITD